MGPAAFQLWRDYFQLAKLVEGMSRDGPAGGGGGEVPRAPKQEQKQSEGSLALQRQQQQLKGSTALQKQQQQQLEGSTALQRQQQQLEGSLALQKQQLGGSLALQRQQQQPEGSLALQRQRVAAAAAAVRAEPGCSFCKQNGESRSVYASHRLKDGAGLVRCPILRRYQCPQCGASGDGAHTRRFCPLTQQGYASVYTSCSRNSAGKRRKKVS